MAGRESAMWQALRPPLVAAKLDPNRIETPFAQGIPDVNITTGWIELKCLECWPVREGIVRIDHFTPEQRAWLLRRHMAGGKAWLLLYVKKPRIWLLFDGLTAQEIVGRVQRTELENRCLIQVGSPSQLVEHLS